MTYTLSTPEGRAEVRRLARSVASACDCDDPRTMEPCSHCWQVSRTLFAALEEIERLRGITPELPDRSPDGCGMPRYGIRWNGPTEPMAVPMEDGYWTPWHLANREIKLLERELAEELAHGEWMRRECGARVDAMHAATQAVLEAAGVVTVKGGAMTPETIGRCRDCQYWHDGKGQQVGASWQNGAGCHLGHKGRFMSGLGHLSGVIGPVKLYPPQDGSGYCWGFQAKEPR